MESGILNQILASLSSAGSQKKRELEDEFNKHLDFFRQQFEEKGSRLLVSSGTQSKAILEQDQRSRIKYMTVDPETIQRAKREEEEQDNEENSLDKENALHSHNTRTGRDRADKGMLEETKSKRAKSPLQTSQLENAASPAVEPSATLADEREKEIERLTSKIATPEDFKAECEAKTVTLLRQELKRLGANIKGLRLKKEYVNCLAGLMADQANQPILDKLNELGSIQQAGQPHEETDGTTRQDEDEDEDEEKDIRMEMPTSSEHQTQKMDESTTPLKKRESDEDDKGQLDIEMENAEGENAQGMEVCGEESQNKSADETLLDEEEATRFNTPKEKVDPVPPARLSMALSMDQKESLKEQEPTMMDVEEQQGEEDEQTQKAEDQSSPAQPTESQEQLEGRRPSEGQLEEEGEIQKKRKPEMESTPSKQPPRKKDSSGIVQSPIVVSSRASMLEEKKTTEAVQTEVDPETLRRQRLLEEQKEREERERAHLEEKLSMTTNATKFPPSGVKTLPHGFKLNRDHVNSPSTMVSSSSTSNDDKRKEAIRNEMEDRIRRMSSQSAKQDESLLLDELNQQEIFNQVKDDFRNRIKQQVQEKLKSKPPLPSQQQQPTLQRTASSPNTLMTQPISKVEDIFQKVDSSKSNSALKQKLSSSASESMLPTPKGKTMDPKARKHPHNSSSSALLPPGTISSSVASSSSSRSVEGSEKPLLGSSVSSVFQKGSSLFRTGSFMKKVLAKDKDKDQPQQQTSTTKPGSFRSKQLFPRFIKPDDPKLAKPETETGDAMRSSASSAAVTPPSGPSNPPQAPSTSSSSSSSLKSKLGVASLEAQGIVRMPQQTPMATPSHNSLSASQQSDIDPTTPGEILTQNSDEATPVKSQPTPSPLHSQSQKKQPSTTTGKLSGQKKAGSQEQAEWKQENNYEISDKESSDESDSDDDRSPKKAIPAWAQKQNLIPALRRQYCGENRPDPDEIFGEIPVCDLEAIFKTSSKKKRYKQRGSSGLWHHDGLTVKEKRQYRKDMGFE